MRIKKVICIALILACVMNVSACKLNKEEKSYDGFTLDNLSANDTFVIKDDGKDYQPYWNYFSSNITSSEDG